VSDIRVTNKSKMKGIIVMAKYGYCRVSTRGQEQNGNSLEAQEKLLLENGADKIISDTFTGTKSDRPNLNVLLNEIKQGDTLIVTKLDRIARSVTQGNELINELLENGIIVNVLNIGIIDNSTMGKLLRNILFSFAEFERDMIIERTQSGKEIARQNPNYREGRKKTYTKEQISHALELLNNMSYRQVTDKTGISKSTLIRAKRIA